MWKKERERQGEMDVGAGIQGMSLQLHEEQGPRSYHMQLLLPPGWLASPLLVNVIGSFVVT